MKILFIGDQVAFFRHMEPILWPLHHEGHNIVIGMGAKGKEGLSDSVVSDFLSTTCNEPLLYLAPRRIFLGNLLTVARDLLGYSIYLKSEHPSPFLADRFKDKMSPFSQKIASKRVFHKMLSTDRTRDYLRGIERLFPPDRKIKKGIAEIKPDIVVAVSSLIWNTPVTDYLKAAKALSVPTVLVIASWDNLTTKSTFHATPDAVFLWNEALTKEAVVLHDMPLEIIHVTGAQTFDYLFEMKPSCGYKAYCKKLGVRPDKPYIVYLGSSVSISGDETGYAREFLSRLDNKDNVSVVLRPHPLNAQIWDDFSAPNLVVSPKGGVWPNALAAKQDLFDVLFHAKAVVGVNTSAMIEAAIMDKPCITIMADEYAHSQAESGHFQHLLQADFLEVAGNFEEANAIIQQILNGTDQKAIQRRNFVQNFIRPRGMERSAGELVATLIEDIHAQKSGDVK